MKKYNPSNEKLTQYIFFTGKGGVGKTSIACATAVSLADSGKKVLLLSTDPASNLQDVFDMPLDNKGTPIKDVPRLTVVNLDPEQAAAEYRESVIAPYRGKLPESVIANMEEQLSGSCTVEVAAFNEFSDFITDEDKSKNYDYIIFDTAPTGHTLRMLQLPSAWDTFIDENTTGASCLGQLSGLEDRKDVYKHAVKNLTDKSKTTLFLVSRPEDSPLKEVERSSNELSDIGIETQHLIINGVLENYDADDSISKQIYEHQQNALNNRSAALLKLNTYIVPLRSYNMTGIDNIRNMLNADVAIKNESPDIEKRSFNTIDSVIEDLYKTGKRVIFTMGKGGVGKTTIAGNIARGLAKKGVKVHLTTTDPANHLAYIETKIDGITVSHIDEKAVLAAYQKNVLDKARETMGDADLSYIEEDLRSPCTQEIAVFNSFAEIVAKADNEVVVIDTAPTGHTLLLLDSTQSYHKEVERTQGNITPAVQNLLPRLRSEKETEVVIVTLPETTPVFEAQRLQQDLQRARIKNKWWVVNSSLLLTSTNSPFLKAKALSEVQWINKVKEISDGNFAVIEWKEKV
ncbi:MULTISPECIES: arsenical pump-driving ATPase [Bacteroidales]|jgi:arsenite-transporting ATPase|uniref:Arsenical pump-driving ATPase n=1 Tax=bioreactor metagenome TaxID=1076179 RepID=A0A644X0V4_9ZZZZ|nr:MULTISPECIES: arsenical pump-driving ATPase [Bacteroidales]OJV82665.1 MAG: arsenical pump-driving ATPase [Bacteroidia bacterium 44-10]MCL3851030.1 arsenical pump-driving ATPase [Parabacteroides leei]MDC2615379.1 arsenical pump-driving ATPase [Bacteroides ovatus]MDC2634653.1 arsenical pump-driving ATPase [Bacteroides ovatus]MDH6305526.1 arsenite-transporting ATPase [Parabacteroides sp. PH5-39]